MIIIFIALIILYLGVILFVGTTFVKISLFAMDKNNRTANLINKGVRGSFYFH